MAAVATLQPPDNRRELGQTVGVRTKFRKLNVDVYVRGISGFRPPMGDGLVSVRICTDDVHAIKCIRMYAIFILTTYVVGKRSEGVKRICNDEVYTIHNTIMVCECTSVIINAK